MRMVVMRMVVDVDADVDVEGKMCNAAVASRVVRAVTCSLPATHPQEGGGGGGLVWISKQLTMCGCLITHSKAAAQLQGTDYLPLDKQN